MTNRPRLLVLAFVVVLGPGCNCGMPPVDGDGGTGGGGPVTGGGAGGGAIGGGGGATGGGGGSVISAGPNVFTLSPGGGRVGQANGLSAEVQVGLVPASTRASGGTFVLEGSAVLNP